MPLPPIQHLEVGMLPKKGSITSGGHCHRSVATAYVCRETVKWKLPY